jgi:hypothetical protein
MRIGQAEPRVAYKLPWREALDLWKEVDVMAGSNHKFASHNNVRTVPIEVENREITLKVKTVRRLSRWDKFIKPYDVSYRLDPAAQ